MDSEESTEEGRMSEEFSIAQCAGVEDSLSAFLAEPGSSGSAGDFKLDNLFRIALKVMGIDMHLEIQEWIRMPIIEHTYYTSVHSYVY